MDKELVRRAAGWAAGQHPRRDIVMIDPRERCRRAGYVAMFRLRPDGEALAVRRWFAALMQVPVTYLYGGEP